MKQKQVVRIKCEKCGEEIELEIFDSINATLNPSLRDKFFNGDVFNFECPHCNYNNYYMYPILYYDMNKKFIMKYGNIHDCIEFYKQIKSQNVDYFENISDVINDYIITCATEYVLAKEKIAALENGLDHRLATIYRVIVENKFKQYVKTKGINDESLFYLGYDNNGVLSICMDSFDNDNCGCKTIFKPINFNIYNEVEKQYSKKLNDDFNFLFNTTVAKRITRFKTEMIKILSDIKDYQLYLIDGGNEEYFFATSQSFAKTNIQIGNLVLCLDSKDNIKKGTIIDKTELFTLITYPYEDSALRILGMLKSINESSENIYDTIDNDDLIEKLIPFKTENDGLPYDLLRDSDVLLREIKDKTNINNERTEFLNNCLIEFNNYFVTRELKGKKYLCVYLQQDKIEIGCNNADVIESVYQFDDIVYFSISSSERYNGIVIDPDGINIVLSNDYLLNVYIPNRVLTIDKRVIKLLETLNKNEIKYVGENEYNIITAIYYDNSNPKLLSSKLGLSIEQIGNYITNGYKKLKEIVKYRFFNN